MIAKVRNLVPRGMYRYGIGIVVIIISIIIIIGYLIDSGVSNSSSYVSAPRSPPGPCSIDRVNHEIEGLLDFFGVTFISFA